MSNQPFDNTKTVSDSGNRISLRVVGNKRLALALVFIIGLVGLSGFFLNRFINIIKREPITIEVNPNLIKMNMEDLIAKSDIIIIGEVAAILPSRWNTSNGKLPDGITIENFPDNMIIYTDNDIEITQILKGEYTGSSIRVRNYGGTVDQDRMDWTTSTAFKIDQTYLLFLTNDTWVTSKYGSEHYRVLGDFQGAYRITDEEAMSWTDEWSLDELIKYIQSTLKK